MRIGNNQLYTGVSQVKYTCPCCGYRTLDSKREYDICPICFWEDDWWQMDNPYRGGGANHVSLYKAQLNFQKFGVCEKEMLGNVRKPRDEVLDDEWTQLPGMTLKELAEVFRLGLMIGYYKPDEVIKWADSRVMHDNALGVSLIEVSLPGSKGINEVISKLDDVKGEQVIQKPARAILGLLYRDLASGKNSLETVTYQLYSLSNVLDERHVDKEILEELRIMDDYYHIYSQETIREKIGELLEKFEDAAEQFTSQVDYDTQNSKE